MIELVVGIVVGLIVFSAILMPTVHSSTDATLTVTNTGSYFTTPDEGEHTIVINAASITYDGKVCTYPDLSLYGSATVVMGEDWFLRLEKSSSTGVNYILGGPPQQYVNLGNATLGDLTVTISGTGFTTTNLSTSATITRSDVTYFIADKGDYVLSHDPYVLNSTEFVAGIRNVSSYDLFEIVSGTVSETDSYDTTPIRMYSFTSLETGTFTDATYEVDLSTVNGDLKKLEQINEDLIVTYSTDGEVTRTITIDYIIVPVEITYDNPAYVGGELSGLIGIIPILIIAGLIIGIVGVALSRRE